jgi:hypothetical protein
MSEKTKFWILLILFAASIALLVYLFHSTENAPLT